MSPPTHPDVLIQIRRMWVDEGMSASEIGRSLIPPRTSNSVIGLVHRNGWRRADDISRRNRGWKARNMYLAAPKRYMKGNVKPGSSAHSIRHLPPRPLAVVDPLSSRNEVVTPPSGGMIPFSSLSDFQCRWVESHVQPAYDMPCCGKVTEAGYSYCEQHVTLAYVVPRPRKLEEKKEEWRSKR